MIGHPILLPPNWQTNPGNILITHRYMNVGIGNQAAQLHFWEYINWIFGRVHYAMCAYTESSPPPIIPADTPALQASQAGGIYSSAD